MEWHFPSDVHTFEFHEHRERAPHLEQDDHRARLLKAAELVKELIQYEQGCDDPECCGYYAVTQVSDLGCGDGGLLSLLGDEAITCWGYDFSPVNEPGWEERMVLASVKDVFNDPTFPSNVNLGNVVILTEVLEHLKDPHHVVRALRDNPVRPQFIVASSPRFETAEHHGDCHQWAWDRGGYQKLFTDAGWKIREVHDLDWSQILVVER